MLYDTRWDAKVETKADPFKLETLIAWLEQQPAGKEYCYFSNGQCLFAQYFRANGYPHAEMSGDRLRPGAGGKVRQIPWEWDGLAQGSTIVNGDYVDGVPRARTFGAALERARKLAVMAN